MLTSIFTASRTLLSSSLLILLCAGSAHSDTFYGLYADADYWSPDTTVNNGGNDMDFDDDGQLMLSASLEHGVPLIPNARLKYADLESSRSFAGINHNVDVTSTDVIAYYEMLDTLVSADIGIGAKIINGDASIRPDNGVSNGINYANESLDETLPEVYASVGAKLPFTGLSARAEASYANNGDTDATDVQVEVKYDFIQTVAVDLGAKVGYRMMDINYDDINNDEFEMEFKGPFVGLEVHF